MKTLWYSPKDIICDWTIQSLDSLGLHEITPYWFDKMDPPVDDGMLEAARNHKPELILYTSVAAGNWLAKTETFCKLADMAPIIHICYDGSDVGWWHMLEEYHKAQCFKVTVCCDGTYDWPYADEGVTLWAPVDKNYYSEPIPFDDRTIPFGFCGGHAADPRFSIVNYLVRNAGLKVRPREEVFGSYQSYADYFRQCRMILNVAYSAGGHDGNQPKVKQLKARVLETAYAGACLLETRGSAAENWFIPGTDYLTYDNPTEAAWIVKTIGREYAELCARNLRAKALANFTPQIYWGKVFAAFEAAK